MRLIDAELFRDYLFRHYELLKVNDYEVWAVVDVDEVLDNIDEVKAIPIKWLEQNAIKWGVSFTMRRLIEAWEKENETV